MIFIYVNQLFVLKLWCILKDNHFVRKKGRQVSSKLELKIIEFRGLFAKEYPAKLHNLVGLWRMAKQTQSADDFKKLRFETHSLKGSSATLNFKRLSDVFANIEQQVILWEKQPAEFANIAVRIDQLLLQLADTVDKSDDPNLAVLGPEVNTGAGLSSQNLSINNKPSEISLRSFRDISIAVVDDDVTSGSTMAKLLATFGFSIKHFRTIEQLTEACKAESFKLVLLDLMMPGSSAENVFKLAKELQLKGTVVFIVSSQNSFEARLAAVRARVSDFMLKPVNLTTLVSKIRKSFKIDLIRPYRILLLDDQATVGTFYKTLLESKGIEVLLLTEAKEIMRSLDAFMPDIFLLDMHMPDTSGLEIARIIRQQPKFDYIPIVFLTSSADIHTKLAALESGADDVIPKATEPQLILQQIDSRIQRSQQIRYLASRDSLTGVLNHGQVMDAAQHAFRLAQRHVKPLIIVMIDLDNFKKVNDSYGHIGGDKVLVSLGQLLLQSVRETDYVGRYGGEEFMVVFSDADAQTIEQKMNSILSAFRMVDFAMNGAVFNCTFSAGLASSENYNRLGELVAAADAALYKAKTAGRNQLCIDSA